MMKLVWSRFHDFSRQKMFPTTFPDLGEPCEPLAEAGYHIWQRDRHSWHKNRTCWFLRKSLASYFRKSDKKQANLPDGKHYFGLRTLYPQLKLYPWVTSVHWFHWLHTAQRSTLVAWKTKQKLHDTWNKTCHINADAISNPILAAVSNVTNNQKTCLYHHYIAKFFNKIMIYQIVYYFLWEITIVYDFFFILCWNILNSESLWSCSLLAEDSWTKFVSHDCLVESLVTLM